MSQQRVGLVTIVLLVGLVTSGCSLKLPDLPGLPGLPGGQDNGRLVFAGPTEVQLAPGETLQPTNIKFVGVQGDRGQFIIADMKATRQIGDSLDWDGEPLPGVRMKLRLRIVWFPDQNAQLAGTVNIEVSDAQPAPGGMPQQSATAYEVPVTYSVSRGKTIPGTTLSYVGSDERGAQLGGTDEYPYRKVADSILWEGRLRSDIGLSVNLRVAFYDDSALQVAGIAKIVLMAR